MTRLSVQNLSNNHRRVLETIALVGILAFGAFLRFHRLRDNPGWFSDEGSDINIAANLIHGRLQYFAIGESPMIAARPLLFHAVLAGGFAVLGEDILTLRCLTAACGIISIFLLFVLTRRLLGSGTALLAAALLAIYPSAILYSRFGFNYNFVALFFLIFAYCAFHYLERFSVGWLIGAAFISGAAIVANPLAVVLVVVLFLMVLIHHRRHVMWVFLAAVLPLVYGAIMLVLSGQAFVFDLAYTFSRFDVSLPVQFVAAVFNYEALWRWDMWFLFGGIGLFLLAGRNTRLWLLGIFFSTLFSVVRVASVESIGFYRLVPLFPFVCLGAAVFIISGVPKVLSIIRTDVAFVFSRLNLPGHSKRLDWVCQRLINLLTSLALFLTLVSPLLVITVRDVIQTLTQYATRFEDAIADTLEAQQTIDYLNHHTTPDDLVLASPFLVWALDNPATDFQQALAYQGVETEHMPGDIPRQRFVFDASYTRARYIVIDELWRGWASASIPEVKALVREVEMWPLEIKIGEFEVYCNPGLVPVGE